MPTYSKEQLLELYQLLPKDLQEAIHSEEIAGRINDICAQNNIIKEEQVSQIVTQVGYVLLGVLAPQELAQTLEQEAVIEKETAEQIVREINQTIFLELKNSLEALYQIKITLSPPPQQTPVAPKTDKTSQEKPHTKDPYRESIE